MIRSFADKMKNKQEAYEAKQKVLAEQAEQARILKEEKAWEDEQAAEQERLNQILAEEVYRKEQKFLEETGQIPTDMGYAIKSNMIKEVFEYKKGVPVKSVKFDKASIYEKMLPSIALVVVLLDE